MAKTRLQKVLQQAGVASRREAERLIQDGAVRVNGAIVVQMGLLVDPNSDAIKVGNKRIDPHQLKKPYLYLALNKPRGYVCTHDDPQQRRTFMDLLSNRYRHKGLVLAGRLDLQSEGLLLLSNDGRFIQRCTHSRYQIPKTYHIKIRGMLSDATINKLARGIVIDGKRTLPCTIKRLGSKETKHTWLSIEVVEGRKHLVRKLFFTVGHGVIKLKRVQIGPVRLGSLRSGQIRGLLPQEIGTILDTSAVQRRAKPRKR